MDLVLAIVDDSERTSRILEGVPGSRVYQNKLASGVVDGFSIHLWDLIRKLHGVWLILK